jgi:hypothetical protein
MIVLVLVPETIDAPEGRLQTYPVALLIVGTLKDILLDPAHNTDEEVVMVPAAAGTGGIATGNELDCPVPQRPPIP